MKFIYTKFARILFCDLNNRLMISFNIKIKKNSPLYDGNQTSYTLFIIINLFFLSNYLIFFIFSVDSNNFIESTFKIQKEKKNNFSRFQIKTLIRF